MNCAPNRNLEPHGWERDNLFMLVDQLPAFVYLQSKDYSIKYANRHFGEQFGDYRSRRCHEIYYGSKEACKKCPTSVVFDSNIPMSREWMSLEGRTYKIFDHPFKDTCGTSFVLKLGIDITEQKRIEAENIRARNLESVGTLAGGIAHDFNNLLTAILGNISLAKMVSHSNDKVMNILDDAEKSSLLAKDLSHQLLTIGMCDNSSREIMPVSRLLKNLPEVTAINSRVKFELSFPGDIWMFEADSDKMDQVVLKLIANACEALPEGGTIRISADNLIIKSGSFLPLSPGRYVKIAFSDKGQGIAKEHLPRIFDPYFTTRKMGARKGIGLGLALCYSIVRDHGGYITAESGPESGTTFAIYLPAVQKES
jgi:signal transduction histidine kinase